MHRSVKGRAFGLRTILALAMLALTAGVTVGTAGPARAQAGSDVVCLYADPNFRGSRICLDDETKLARFRAADDNVISSFQIEDGWGLRVCEEPDFGGWCRNFAGDVRRLNASNDAISSFEVFRILADDPARPAPAPSGVVCLYPDPNFAGDAICVAGATRVARLQPWEDDRISSFRVADGWQLTACERPNFGGWCRDFQASETNLRASNDAISSFEVKRVAAPQPQPQPQPQPPRPQPQPTGVVCLYEDPGFGGNAMCANGPTEVARLQPWQNDRVSSFRVADGWKLTACEHANFGGWCREFTSDEANLRASNDAISSYRVERVPVLPTPRIRVACLFSEANYGGLAICAESADRVSDIGPRLSRAISSLRLASGWSIIMCTEPNMGGFCRRADADEPQLGPRLNDRVVSYEVFPTASRPTQPRPQQPQGGGGIITPGADGPTINLGGIIGAIAGEACLYEHVNYGGAKICGGAGMEQRNMPPGQNDVVSSLRVPDGLMITACEDADFGGTCRRFTRDAAFVGPDFNDRISSFRITPNF